MISKRIPALKSNDQGSSDTTYLVNVKSTSRLVTLEQVVNALYRSESPGPSPRQESAVSSGRVQGFAVDLANTSTADTNARRSKGKKREESLSMVRLTSDLF